jgi:hypothetical protein
MKEHTRNIYCKVKPRIQRVESYNQIKICIYVDTYGGYIWWLKLEKYFVRTHGLSYSSLSSYFRRVSEYSLFWISQTLVYFLTLFSFFFMNNFCIVHASFLQQNFWEIVRKIWSIYLVDILLSMFLVFTPNVRLKHFLVDLNGMTCFASTASVGAVHMWVVCTWS